MSERKALLRISMTVKTNTTTRTSDKVPTFVVGMKSDGGTLAIGMKEAKAQLKIKAEDDIAFYNFPIDGEYIIEVYPKTRNIITVPQAPTVQTPLPSEEPQITEATATVPEGAEEEIHAEAQ
jgi:hypothetical protein